MAENEEQKSLYQKHKEKAINTLREIDKRLCMPEQTPTSDVENILLMSREQLKKLSREDCKDYSYLLNQHAFFIQRDLNHCSAWIDQATRIKAKCLDPEDKAKCDDIIEAANLKILKGQYLPKRIEAMAKSLDNIAFERKKNEYT